ncbi:hypothetical protein BKA82DRAFT_308533 [Pisolithus tinctorius]|uniref:Uncharacterized protein n=1 Tax=Pisolithus tinctorius Marx 270 TaxID=870435 RepID=A0A0C3JJC7_PISTI|nr:hypothetical protein BKA82DRAFT_308533 [Pisolithus tinctorius]KIO09203.1 hypothetical protein M404DRAFT_308533 [Pisolithus tinctorius Marx 270]
MLERVIQQQVKLATMDQAYSLEGVASYMSGTNNSERRREDGVWRSLNEMPPVIGVKCHRYRGSQVYRCVVGRTVGSRQEVDWHCCRREAASSGPAVFTALGSKDAAAALLPVSRLRFCRFPTPTAICSCLGLPAYHSPRPQITPSQPLPYPTHLQLPLPQPVRLP